jgi:hypothetical protein
LEPAFPATNGVASAQKITHESRDEIMIRFDWITIEGWA